MPIWASQPRLSTILSGTTSGVVNHVLNLGILILVVGHTRKIPHIVSLLHSLTVLPVVSITYSS